MHARVLHVPHVLPCFSALPGRHPGHEAPCSCQESDRGQEKRSCQFKQGINTKNISSAELLLYPALKPGIVFCLLNPSLCLFHAAPARAAAPKPPLLPLAARPGWTPPAQPTTAGGAAFSHQPFICGSPLEKGWEFSYFVKTRRSGRPMPLAGINPSGSSEAAMRSCVLSLSLLSPQRYSFI